MKRLAAHSLLAAAAAIASIAIAAPPDVAVEVGDLSLRVSDVQRRVSALPPHQFQALGDDDTARVRRLVEEALIPELLYANAARARSLEESPSIRNRVAQAYQHALLDAVAERARTDAPVSEHAVEAYYRQHEDHFRSEQRLLLWRIAIHAMMRKLVD